MKEKMVTILLAEDDDGHAMLVERNLHRAGFVNTMVRLKDWQEALDYLFRRAQYRDRELPDSVVLLLDINMPRIDGIEVLRQLKSDEKTATIPVIVLTTTDDPREVQRCYELGCNVYVTKPVAHDAFIDAIRRLGMFLQIVAVPENGLHH